MSGPVLSVVDYDAWEKGYMPPSEHILIDKLSYRGARVVLSTWLGGDGQVWVVLEGKPLTNKQRKILRDMVALFLGDEDETPQTPLKPAEDEPRNP